jgi:hypothetical protein
VIRGKTNDSKSHSLHVVQLMILRFFLLLLGFGLAVSGGVSIIAYLNILTTGVLFIEYLMFISTKVECYLLPIGITVIWLSIYG